MKGHFQSISLFLSLLLWMTWLLSPSQAAMVNCTWDKDDLEEECFSTLVPLTAGIKQWFFLGDSTMFRVLRSLSALYGTEFKVLRSSPPSESNKLNYYGYATNMRYWVPPNETLGEGPSHGQPFRTLCSSCQNTRMQHNATKVEVEFLSIEHALDVEFPTDSTRTSQETAVKYITQQQQPAFDKDSTLCVANTGFHELLIRSLTPHMYSHNVVDYWLQMLQAKVCRHILWININSVSLQPEYSHSNRRIRKFNAAVWERLRHTNISGAYVDIHPYSTRTEHADDKHMSFKLFYFPLGRLYHRLLLAGALSVAPRDAEKNFA